MKQEQVTGRTMATDGDAQGGTIASTNTSQVKPKYTPVMQSEKAVNYFRVYVLKGIERYGRHYATPIDELVDRFSRQTFGVKQFLEMVRHEESEKQFKAMLETAGSSTGRRRVSMAEGGVGCPHTLRPCRYPAMVKGAEESVRCPYTSELCPFVKPGDAEVGD
jgi:hypothetical protein